jgi:hypothetical protein
MEDFENKLHTSFAELAMLSAGVGDSDSDDVDDRDTPMMQ